MRIDEGCNATTATNQPTRKDKAAAFEDDEKFDAAVYPREFSNAQLGENWFDFNDASVTAIKANRLQKQFGGSSSSESAYILVYRKRALTKNAVDSSSTTSVKLPPYILPLITEENGKITQERAIYEEALQHLNLRIHRSTAVNWETMNVATGYDLEKEGDVIRVRTDITFKQLIEQLKVNSNSDIILAEIIEHQNKFIQVPRLIDVETDDEGINTLNNRRLRDEEISHDSSWLIIHREDALAALESARKITGINNIPLKINIVRESTPATSVLAYSQQTLAELKATIALKTLVPVEYQYLTTEDLTHVNSSAEKEAMTLEKLKISNDFDLILKQIDQVSIGGWTHRCIDHIFSFI